MASKAVIDAVKARLGVSWNGMAVVMPNDIEDAPADGSPFLTVQFPVANVSRQTIDRRVYREEGGFRLIINAARGGGTDTVLTVAEQLATLFRDKNFGGVATQVPSAPFLDDSNDRGNYFVAAVVVPYTFNFEG